MGDAERPNSFGEIVSAYLARASATQSTLAVATGKSRSYVNHTLAGRKPASPEWVALVSNALALPRQDRARLMRAAALDAGYELDLSKK